MSIADHEAETLKPRRIDMTAISQDLLHSLFRYEDGRLFNRVWRAQSQPAGAEAGGVRSNGYRYVSINNRSYLQHRLVWMMFNGDDMPDLIDHIDRDPLNNRIENLRTTTKSKNGFNRRPDRRNAHPGIWLMANGRWRAGICVDYRSVHIGCFGSLDDAIAARRAAEIQHFGENSIRDHAHG